AVVHRLRVGRALGCGARREPAEDVLLAGGPHRLHLRGGGRRAGAHGGAPRAGTLRHARLPRLPHRAAPSRSVCEPARLRHDAAPRARGGDQRRGGAGLPAHQGARAAVRLLRRLGDSRGARRDRRPARPGARGGMTPPAPAGPAIVIAGGGPGRALRGLAAALAGARRSRALLRELAPRVVVGVGGYASVAAVLAARSARIPTLVLEQNAVPGAANRLLGRLAARVCVGFAEAVGFFPRGRAVHTGNPVRRDILRARSTPRPPRLGLLVFGGSQGAHRLNQAMLAA